MCFAALKLNPIAPTPLRPASSYVGGLPQACQIGGCGLLYGFGKMFRGGTENDVPSNEYSPSRHIFGNSGRTSSYMGFVSSVDSMPELVTSSAPAPRPVANSNRRLDGCAINVTASGNLPGRL